MTHQISEPLTDNDHELAANMAAHRTYMVYSQTALLFALTEKKVIDINRVLEFNRLNASIFRQMAAQGSTDPISIRANSIIVEMHEQLEATVRNMMTVPAGAGRA